MSDKNTISDLLARLVVDVNNMNNFLYKLDNILESKSESVTIEQTLSDGSTKSFNVPSFGYLKGKITDVNEKFDTLISANDDVIGIKSANGEVRKFELKKVSKLVQELEDIKSTNLTVPTSFGIKNNWFFESFLNPLLFVSIDISTILTDNIDQFSVKRIIINAIDDDQLEYFDENYKNVNDINLNSLILDLQSQGIDYFEDDNIVTMDVAVNRYKGSFDVTRIKDEEIPQTLSDGSVVTVFRRRYKLSTLNYTDILDKIKSTKTLAIGDVLITDNDSEYKITSVDKTNTEVVMERIFGIEPLTMGADVAIIKPVPYRPEELQVNVGYNERQIIFIKPISRGNNLTVSDYSNGFGSYSNELDITLEDDSTSTLEEYYNNFVADFGLILLSAAKEKKVPAIIAEAPNTPALTASNFSVKEITAHINNTDEAQDQKNKLATSESLKNRINEADAKIKKLNAKLNSSAKTETEKNKISASIKKAANEKESLSTQYRSVVRDYNTLQDSSPTVQKSKKFRVRGFWPVPAAKDSKYGTQQIVQFKIRYRYLSKEGTSANTETSEVGDGEETTFAAFSNWREITTTPRKKKLNEDTGLFEWETPDLSNSEEVNCNQLDIPITSGEILEFQIKSLSEAGWPENPVESNWSAAIQVPFSEEIGTEQEASAQAQRMKIEEAQLDFEDSLNSRGLIEHLNTQFQTGEKLFVHSASDIASGFFTTENNNLDLFQKLTSMERELVALQQSISLEKGVIKVSIIGDDGSISEVKNGDTVSLFAGNYRDQIKDTSSTSIQYNDGDIIAKQYVISIENSSSTALELISSLRGGIEQVAPESDPSIVESDYHVNRRYDLVPMSVNSISSAEVGNFSHKTGYQSTQVMGQYIASRFKNYGLSQDLYGYYPSTGYTVPTSTAYDYKGNLAGADRVPMSWGHYLPFDPTFDNTGVFLPNANIWNGTNDAAGSPNTGGFLSEFCIHKDHPSIPDSNSYDISSGNNLKDLFEPVITAPTQEYMEFSHALFMETSSNEGTGVLGNLSYQQASRTAPTAPTSSSPRNPSSYPIKLGFAPDDKFLVGKYTCGSYLYMLPNSYADISVEGNHPSLSVKTVEVGSENAINLSVIFQYRCSDILANVGGFRTNELLTNIRYSKKTGVDIYIKNESPFSFDIEASVQYKKETQLDAPIASAKGKVINF
tara:strand:+ start:3758 stop:7297 length:3540 start_codon:yes stop_codon:yes gene_type:complete